MTTLNPTSPGRRSRVATVVLAVLAGAAVFGAGVGVSLLLRGNGSADPGASTPPVLACTTGTTIPAQALPKPGTVSINVFNATNRRGLAASTAATLKQRGFVIGKIANDPLGKVVAATAELRLGPAGAKSAALLVFYLPKAALVKDTRTDASVDVVVGNAFTGVASQDAVTVALNKPVATKTGPGCTPKPATKVATKAPASPTSSG